MHWPVETFAEAIIAVLVFGLLGIGLIVFGFKFFDWLLPKVDFQMELAEKQNVAVAIVLSAVILAVSAVIIAAMLA